MRRVKKSTMSLLNQLNYYRADLFGEKISHILRLVNTPAMPLACGLVRGIGSEKARERESRSRHGNNLLQLNHIKSLEVILYHLALGHAGAAITLTGSDRNQIPIFDIEILKLFFQHNRPQDFDKALAMIYATTAYSVVALNAISSLNIVEREEIRNLSAQILATSKRPEFNDSTTEEQQRHVETALRHKIQMLLFLNAKMPAGDLKQIAAGFIPELEKIASLPFGTDLDISAADGDVARNLIPIREENGRTVEDRRTNYQLQMFSAFGINGSHIKTKVYPSLNPETIIVRESDMRENIICNNPPIEYYITIPFLQTVLNVIEGSRNVNCTYGTYGTYSQISARCNGYD